MELTQRKFRIAALLFSVCLLVLVLTSFAPVFLAFQSKATRLYPENASAFVRMNQIFVYKLPAEILPLFPFGIHCGPESPSMLENGHSVIIATTIHDGRMIGILPDPVNKVLLPANSKVSIRITGMCDLPLPVLRRIRLPIEYVIIQETFQVGESLYSHEDLDQLVASYFGHEIFPFWPAEIFAP